MSIGHCNFGIKMMIFYWFILFMGAAVNHLDKITLLYLWLDIGYHHLILYFILFFLLLKLLL
jgi:hypothetical protein